MQRTCGRDIFSKEKKRKIGDLEVKRLALEKGGGGGLFFFFRFFDMSGDEK